MKEKSQTAPVHPGEIPLEEFMKPMSISINGLALELRLPTTRISAIVNEARGITADTALRLGRYFSTTSEFRMNLQRDFDLRANESRKILVSARTQYLAQRDARTSSAWPSGLTF
jgi:addiction module HigA family antidote